MQYYTAMQQRERDRATTADRKAKLFKAQFHRRQRRATALKLQFRFGSRILKFDFIVSQLARTKYSVNEAWSTSKKTHVHPTA